MKGNRPDQGQANLASSVCHGAEGAIPGPCVPGHHSLPVSNDGRPNRVDHRQGYGGSPGGKSLLPAAGCRAQSCYGCYPELQSWGLQALKGPLPALVICQQDRSCGRRSLSSGVCCPQMADPVPDGDDHRTLQQNVDESLSHAQRQAVRAR